ncbi:uncharacterized protein LOC134835047 [Culicoides brevitarsis]|uniref:uncharacterized protein LOC134835047 n=1 Tax=Culicoides brevitarsis TaxID=469753 RepID=UPI00307BCE5F
MARFVGKRLLISRLNVLLNQKRTGYIVLVPEIGEEPGVKNPLLREDGFPEFNNVTIENCVAYVGHQALDLEKSVQNIEGQLIENNNEIEDIFGELINPIEKEVIPLETTWGLAKTIYMANSTLMPTKSYLSIHNRAFKATTMRFNSLPIFTAVKKALVTKNFTEEQTRVLEKYILETKLNGVCLLTKDRQVLNEILNKLSNLKKSYGERVNTSIKQFKHYIHDSKSMKEFPPHLLQTMADNQEQPTKGPWKVTLHPYVYKAFLEYCPNHDLRWNIWQAETRKASGYYDKNSNNSIALEEIRGLRQDQAKLLGYKNYAEMSMETKMLGSVDDVEKMLASLLERAKPAQEEEINNLVDFAESNGFKHKFEIYDISYWKRKQLLEQFDFDDEQIRDYFSTTKVLDGMFALSEQLFKIKIHERGDVVAWNEDVKVFDVFDINDSREPIGAFYIDLYRREDLKMSIHENSGWMIGIRNRSSVYKSKPLAALIFNFSKPLYGKPSLLNLQEIQKLFFEFGQTLQHLLTKANYSDVSGLSNISWDMVETSGNLMTHLLFEATTLKMISCHYSTKDELTDSQIKAIQQSKMHLSAFDLCEEIYLSTLDLELHKTREFWLDIVKSLYPKHFVFDLDKKYAYPCSFSPIFAGEWGAAYFSHLHARLIAADVHSAFEEARKLGKEEVLKVGKRYRDTFMGLGGACDQKQAFRKFRGRDPSPKALLKTIKNSPMTK